MLQALKDRAEPHVLDPALSVRVDDEPEVLGPPLEVEREHKLPFARLALADKKHAVAGVGVGLTLEHQLGGVRAAQCPVEPGVFRQLQVDLGAVVKRWNA